MRDLLGEGSAWLAGQRRRYAASRVSYARGAAVTRLPASRSRGEALVEENDGLHTRIEIWIWIVHVDELKLDNVPVVPSVGDRITAGPPGNEAVYEVMDVPGESHWRWVDAYKNEYRIHTKKIG